MGKRIKIDIPLENIGKVLKKGNKAKLHSRQKNKKEPPFNSSADDLLNEIDSDSLDNDAQDFIDNVDLESDKLTEITPQQETRMIPKIRPKETGQISNIEISENLSDLRICPNCKRKLKKKWIKRIDNTLFQEVRCKKCKFEKEIIITL